MRVGIPNAEQLNALETLNLRGERSVTCEGAFDAPSSSGPLPADAPAACETVSPAVRRVGARRRARC